MFLESGLGAKRLDLLRQLVPKATLVAVLVNPGSVETEAERREETYRPRRKGSGSNSSFSMLAATAILRHPLRQSRNAVPARYCLWNRAFKIKSARPNAGLLLL